MSRYLLDTSVIVDYLRGKKEVIALVDELEGEVVSSTICLAELYEGAFRVTNPESVLPVLEQFFASLSRVYPIDEMTAKEFGRERADLRKKGIVIEDLDILIACSCLVYHCTLVTKNIRHFSRVSGLKLYQN